MERPTLKANLVLLELTIKRPSGRAKSDKDKVKVEAQAQYGGTTEVGAKRMTRPSWIYDTHHLWGRLDANAREIGELMKFYAVNDKSGDDKVAGSYMVSMYKMGELLQQLEAKKQERDRLAQELADKWESEAIPQLQTENPEHFFQIRPLLPSPDTFVDKFAVRWTLRRLAPMSDAEVDVSQLSPTDAEEVRRSIKKMCEDKAREQLDAVMSNVFGEVADVCEQINLGSLESGTRRPEAITNLLNVLDRVQNFAQFADEEVLRRVAEARSAVAGVSISDLNKNSSIQQAVKAAFAPLGEAVRQLQEDASSGRVRRRIIMD
jgi:hypothetical protein